MAETTKSLDYSGGSMLDRYARARRKQATGSASVDVGGVISGVGEMVSQEAQIKKDTEDAALANWDKGFDSMGDRGSWASPQLFDQFQDLESTFKDQYVAAVESGDKKLQQSLLTQQGNRATSLQAWTETMEAAAQINNGPGWGHVVTSNTENKALLEALAKNDGSAKPIVGEGGELMFEFNGKRYSRRDVDDMVAGGTFPSAAKNNFLQGLASQYESGLKGGAWNEDLTMQANLNSLDNDKMASYIYDPITGSTSFAKDFKVFENASFTFPTDKALDVNNDGEINSVDFNTENMAKMIEAMQDPENLDVAKQIIAEYMTMKQKKNFDKGEKKFKEMVQDGRISFDKGK